MTLNKLAEIVLNLSNTVETGFSEIRQDIKAIKEDVADIKRCPTIQKELIELSSWDLKIKLTVSLMIWQPLKLELLR